MRDNLIIIYGSKGTGNLAIAEGLASQFGSRVEKITVGELLNNRRTTKLDSDVLLVEGLPSTEKDWLWLISLTKTDTTPIRKSVVDQKITTVVPPQLILLGSERLVGVPPESSQAIRLIWFSDTGKLLSDGAIPGILHVNPVRQRYPPGQFHQYILSGIPVKLFNDLKSAARRKHTTVRSYLIELIEEAVSHDQEK